MPTSTTPSDLLATLASDGGSFGDGIAVTEVPNGNSSMQRTASYFFGFLVSFVVLVSVSVVCGLLSRRRIIDRRRRMLDWTLQPWTENMQDGEIQIPALIQKEYVKVHPVNQSSDWKELIPLAVKGVNGKEFQPQDDTLAVSHSTTVTSGSYSQRSSQNLPVMTLTISTATTTTTATHSNSNNESLTRSNSNNSSHEPYPHHQSTPNVIISQQQIQIGELFNANVRQTRPGFFQHFTPKLWHNFPIGRRNRGREEYVNDDIEQGHHDDCSAYDEKGGHEEKDEERERFLEVAVMIEMPSPYSEQGDRMREYEFGIAQVPLHDQVDCIKP